jgi:hypothetical protein
MRDMVPDGGPANDATAQTLNYALGNLGGRQKSWMQANPSPADLSQLTQTPLPFEVRRRGRPRKIPVPVPPQSFLTAPADPPPELHPPSNSTSPQLANILTRHDINNAATAVIELPSPTPSEENMATAPAPASRGDDAAANFDFVDLSAEEARYASDIPLETSFMDSVRSSGSGLKRPSDQVGPQTQKRSRGEGHEPEGQAPLEQSVAGRPIALTTQQPQYPTFPRRSSTQHDLGSRPQLAHSQVRSPSLGTPSNNAQMQPPQTRHSMQNPSMSTTPPQPQAPFTSSCALTGSAQDAQPAWYTPAKCLHVLDTFQLSHPEASKRDGRRIGVLREAAGNSDWPYLLMHQLYCLLDYNPTSLPFSLQSQPGLMHASRVMQDVLDTNIALSPAVLDLFCNFPYPLHEIQAKWPSALEYHVRSFASFVEHAHNYDKLKLTCERRRFPPVVSELALHLRLASKTFQRLLFTAVLRCIWQGVPRSNHNLQAQYRYETRATDIFYQNQIDYYHRITLPGAQPHSDIDLQCWGRQLRAVVVEFEVQFQNQSNSASAQYAGVPLYPHQYSAPAQQFLTNSSEHDMSARGHRVPQPHSVPHPVQQTRGRGRPPAQSVPAHVLPSQLGPRLQQTQQPQPVQRPQQGHLSQAPAPLLPPRGRTLAQQRTPNPARFSLHQAHLRSPILKARSMESPLYHYVQGFFRAPARLSNAGQAVEKWTFHVTPEMIQCMAALHNSAPGAPDMRIADALSKTFRLRCIKWPAKELPTESAWAIADTSWIPYSYFSLNGTSLQQRKKIHNGKDLPIDITGLLRLGDNVLEVTVMAQTNDIAHLEYLVAIECLGVVSQDIIERRCLEERCIPPDKVIDAIKQKLAGNNDEDVAMVDANLSVNLFDPFSASAPCDIPVRSEACAHNDCFDLDTFLTTRTRKGGASLPDLWRCPICNADARPHLLIVDGFIQLVKAELERYGHAKTRTIIVRQDGSWIRKPEVRDPNGVSDRGASTEPPTPTIKKRAVPVGAEVIDLSD